MSFANGVSPCLPFAILQSPFETLNSNKRNHDGNSLIYRSSKPSLNSAHANPNHRYTRRIDIIALQKIINGAPKIPTGFKVKRHGLRFILGCAPSLRNGFVISLCTFFTTRSCTMIPSIDCYTNPTTLCELFKPRFLALFITPGAMQHDYCRKLGFLFGR